MALIAVPKALETIQTVSTHRSLTRETISLEHAAGRILADPLISPIDLPPFDNSAMDGFALPITLASPEPGDELDVSGEVAAGMDPAAFAGTGALAVMTGAALLPGIGCVIPVEDVEILARHASDAVSRIRLLKGIRAGQHCRRAGQDVMRGEQVLPSGHRLRNTDLPLLRGLGIERLRVWTRPRIAVLCTGGELLAPGETLGPGQIYDSNGLSLALTLQAAGAELVLLDRIPDQPEALRAALKEATGHADIVVSTGAVSMGRYDFVPQTLHALGAQQHFHKLAMRPGKPMLFATLPDGRLYFGLPGNPVSSLVGARFFVNAAIRALLGLAPEQARWLPLNAPVSEKPQLTMFQKARLLHRAGEVTRVERLAGQESFRLAPLLAADAWAVLPAEPASLPMGELVQAYPLEPFGW